MDSTSLVFLRVELRVRGLMFVVVGLAAGAVDALSRGVDHEVSNVATGAVLFGGFIYWEISRRTRQGFEIARPAGDVTPESLARTCSRVFSQSLVMFLITLLLDLAGRDSISVAGFPLGAGVASIVLAFRMSAWENERQARLLRRAASFHLTLRWSNAIKTNDYRLAPAPPAV